MQNFEDRTTTSKWQVSTTCDICGLTLEDWDGNFKLSLSNECPDEYDVYGDHVQFELCKECVASKIVSALKLLGLPIYSYVDRAHGLYVAVSRDAKKQTEAPVAQQ